MAQLKDLIVNGPSRFIGDVYATTFTGNLAGNASTATSATNAGTVGGLSVHSGRNNEANKIVRTDGNGYLQVGYINSSSGHEKNASSPTYVWGSNSSDSYLRSYQTSSLSVKYATTSGSCSGNAATATKATQDSDGNIIRDHYIRIDGNNGTEAGVSALINKLGAGSSTPTDADYYVCQYAGGGTTTTTYHRRPMSSMWNWIKAKTDTLYPTKSGSGATGTWGISISGNAATATKVGTSTVGSSTMPVYIKSGTPTAITSFPEAYLSWGGKNFAASYGPIDAAMIPDLGACRSMFAKAAGITVQYSRDGGSTWVDYGCTDTQKTGLFSVGYEIVIGGTTETGIDKSNYKSRVIVTTNLAGIYTYINKIAIYVLTGLSNGSNVTIDARTKANVDAGNDTWTTLADRVTLAGNSGWNIINIPNTITYGNTSTQYQQIRFTFGVTSHASTLSNRGLTVSRIMMFGGVGWSTPSNMAKHGHLYNYDVNQNATFPAAVTSTKFVKSGGTSAQFLKADGSVDSNTYSKSNHTHTSVLDVGGSTGTTFAYSKAGLSYGDYTYLAGWNGYELRAINKSQFAQASHTHTKSQITDFAHTHTKSQITDFPSSLPASDVYSWAKQSTKPSYTGSEVKLTGYSKASSYSVIAASDTVNQAIGKLEGAISGLEELLASI